MDFILAVVIGALVLAAVLIGAYLYFGRSESSFSFDIGGGVPKASGGSDTSAEKTFSGRLKGFLVYVSAIFATLLVRLWSMQLISTDEYARLSELNRTRTIRTAAPRGRILDRNGTEIVTNRPSLTIVAGPDVVQDVVEVQLLSNLCGMPYMATRRKIRDESEGAQSKRTVSVDVSRRVVAFIAAHPGVFPDVDIEERSERFYPY
ncbi:MAG TPA: penicillin-binding protein 2, partial [Atopobiaceae bacterium]|nr:penicillin-binding protein 2 [Atopobiaceae bacterium]